MLPTYIENVLTSIYNSKDRYYHTNKHLKKMLDTLDILIENYYIDKKIDTDLMTTAILFHDAVMFEENDVEKSARIAELLLKDIYTEEQIEHIKNLIMATDYSTITDKFDEQLIRDLDLFILASDWSEYYEYMKGIFYEYGKDIPLTRYIEGRKRVLENMLQWETIYETDIFKEYNDKARENIKRELKEL